MADQVLVKKTSYFVQGLDLGRAVPDDPKFEATRQEVSALLEDIRKALADRPESVRAMDESLVPAPPIELPRACVCCSYTRVVNFREVEHWGSGARGCGDCGIYIESSTRVVNYQMVEDIIESWEYQVVAAPQP